MNKLCIIPFTKEEFPLLSSAKKNYSISSLVTPSGFGISGEDVSVVRNCSPTGYHFTNSVSDGINSADTILISKVSPEMESLFSFAFDALELAAKSSKEIHCFLPISETEKQYVLSLCKKSGSICHFMKSDFIDVKYAENIQLLKFDVPVFCISEAISDCDGYDVFLGLADTFRSMGRKVLAISDNCYNQFLGYTTLDFDANICLRYQAFRINAIIHELVKHHRPDVVLIMLPRPMLQFDAKVPFDCGVTAFAISQAISFDGCILCVQSGSPPGSFWENISNTIQTRFTCPVFAVHVSNRIIDMTENLKLPSIRLPYKMISEEVDRLNKYSELEFYQLLEREALDEVAIAISNEYLNLPYGVI